MKFVLIVYFCFFVLVSIAQEESKVQLFNVHEDPIRPDMLSLYEESARKLADGLRKHKMDVNYVIMQREDLSYLFFLPISDMGSMWENNWRKLRPKMPSEYDSILTDFKKCFDSHGYYMLELHKELSYNRKLEGLYRRLIYCYVPPEKEKNFITLAKEVKQKFVENKVGFGYRIYKSGYGNVENYFIIELSSKDAVSMVVSMNEFEDYRDKLLNMIIRIEDMNGRIRPDLSYNGID